MRRLGILAIAVAVALSFVVSRWGTAPAQAGADPLTPAMQKQIDASLIVFWGEIVRVGPAAAGRDAADRQWVEYRVDRVLKGAYFERELVVQHVVADQPGFDPKTPRLDPARFAAGERMLLGVQLRRIDAASYALVNSRDVLLPAEWSEALEDAAARYTGMATTTVTAKREVAADPGLASKQRTLCMNNLAQLGQVFLMLDMENQTKARRWSGPALWLTFRKSQAEIKRGDERVLLCPADPGVRVPSTGEERKAWDNVDLDNPAPGLCSYAGRDFTNFPFPKDATDAQAIGACLHHAGGAVVSFSDGSCKFMTLAELGIASDAEKIVGPDSKSPILRVLR